MLSLIVLVIVNCVCYSDALVAQYSFRPAEQSDAMFFDEPGATLL